MHVRAMVSQDAPAVADLCTQLGYPATPADIERRLALLAADPDQALLVAEEADGRVIGWVHVHGRRLIAADPYAELGGLVVDAASRGRGVGTALMRAAEAWALARGYGTLRVRSGARRADAHRFYERIGYALEKSQQVFVKPLKTT